MIVNCDSCGRDTCNRSRLCRHCTAGSCEVAPKAVAVSIGGIDPGGRDEDVAADVDRAMREAVEWK